MPADTFDPSAPVHRLCANTIRTLAMDAVQKANSGHPGAPMGLAPAGAASTRSIFRVRGSSRHR